MMRSRCRAGRVLTAGAGIALAAACGGGGHSSGGSSGYGSGAGTRVATTEHEYAIGLALNQFAAGTYTFDVSNAGKLTHQFQVDGPGVEDKHTGRISPGGKTSFTVTLKKGTYELYCPVDGHKGLGMDMKITVN
jgi:uncharacterized cupredoxin-like copper-binding protein